MPWTTYLAGQRLAKLFEAGFMPVSVAAALSSVRVWAYCMTEYLMEGGSLMWAGSNVEEADQVVDAHMASYQVAREHVRGQLGGDQLHGRPHARPAAQPGGGRRGRRVSARGDPGAAFQGLRPRGAARAHGAAVVTLGSGRGRRRSTSRPRCGGRPTPSPIPAARPTSHGATSDLSIDEALLLHSVEWEVLDLVCGVSVFSVPAGVWTWGQGAQIGAASDAHGAAFQGAAARLAAEGARVGGQGVVGVRVGVEVHPHSIQVELVGTAVRPVGQERPGRPFVSDLSGRDFALLLQAGWMPVGLAFGASFVYAPRRSAAMALAQKTQNVELTNVTEAMYSARESAMARMQQSALDMGDRGSWP